MTTLLTHTETRTQRDQRGRFVKGNSISKHGGHARAKALTPKQRKAISRKGWRGLVRKQFAGDEAAARAWFGALGAWCYDQQLLDIYGAVRSAFPYPGTPTEYRARRYQLYLLAGPHLDVNFYKAVQL